MEVGWEKSRVVEGKGWETVGRDRTINKLSTKVDIILRLTFADIRPDLVWCICGCRTGLSL